MASDSKECTSQARLEANGMILDLLMRSRYWHDYLIAFLNARKTIANHHFILIRQARQLPPENLDVLEDKTGMR